MISYELQHYTIPYTSWDLAVLVWCVTAMGLHA